MSIRLHLVLMTMTSILGLLGGLALGMLAFEALDGTLPDALSDQLPKVFLFWMAPAVAGYTIARGTVGALVPARCPRCGGKAAFQPSRRKKAVIAGSTTTPVSYRCRDCGHVQVTGVTEGTRPDQLP